ncbi:MAG: nuclear transport factor 2 family protein [Spirosomaceae bacterium]|jgi:hypothetical protein|nr:nuclear transport factor 2 family protein [Spirosomataceae bacterium]
MLKIIVLFLFSWQIFAQSKIEKEVIEIEKKRFDALVNKDYVFLERVFSEQLIYNHADGKIDNKQSFLQGLKDGRRTYKSIGLDTISVQQFDKTAIIRGDVNFLRINKNQQQIAQKLRYSAVYVLQKKEWRMVSWHSTDITPKK